MPRTATPADLTALLTPFVDTGRAHHRGDGSRVDLLHVCNSIDADIRAVTSAGVERYFDGFAEFIPWAAIRRVTINGAAYEVAPARRIAA